MSPMKLMDALGLGLPDGKTVIPVSIWVPVLVLFSALAALLLTGLEGESAPVQLAVVATVGALTVVVAAVLTRRRERR